MIVITLELIMEDSIKEKNVTTEWKYTFNKGTLITINLTTKQPPVLKMWVWQSHQKNSNKVKIAP